MSAGQTPDEWLMVWVAQGRRDSLEILLRRHASPLLTFITRMIGDRHRSEELFQETFLAVWENRRQFNRRLRFKPWLYRIALNRCRASFRRRPLPVRHTGGDELPALVRAPDPAPDQLAVATETQSLVAAAVAALPYMQRLVVVLRVWCQMPYSEVAKILSRREATVRSHMHHALASLREYLEPRMQ